jgi:hypothetical protein
MPVLMCGVTIRYVAYRFKARNTSFDVWYRCLLYLRPCVQRSRVRSDFDQINGTLETNRSNVMLINFTKCPMRSHKYKIKIIFFSVRFDVELPLCALLAVFTELI